MDPINSKLLGHSKESFENVSTKTARSIHDALLKTNGTRIIADILHGVWLGHPFHPALTDVVVGAWGFASVLDMVGMGRRSKSADQAADLLVSIGNAMALPTALSGLADFSAAPKRSMTTGALHAILNTVGLALNVRSAICRGIKRRGEARALSAAACGIMLASAWLGGKLVFDKKTGVNKAAPHRKINEWKFAARESELQESEPQRVDVDGNPVLIVKSGARISAIGAVCCHEGGPLDKGEVCVNHVLCPWHQSVFDLENGKVIHGPSVFPEPAFKVRTLEGNVEIRSA